MSYENFAYVMSALSRLMVSADAAIGVLYSVAHVTSRLDTLKNIECDFVPSTEDSANQFSLS